MIEFYDVEKYYGDFYVFKNINLMINEGEKVVLIGLFGLGKSILIWIVNGLECV